jgi:hypothetical protein
VGEFDQRAWEVGLAGISDRQTSRERAFSAFDPDFPIDAEWQSRLTAADLRALSPLKWQHVNPYGTFTLDMHEAYRSNR